MPGRDGKTVINMSWDEYTRWQRWDEWPERANNPPLTVETTFWYQNKEYLVTSLRNEYVIVSQPDFDEIICSDNFISLLNMPFIGNQSFKDLICEFLFEV